MNKSLSLYYLYCINRSCDISIYHRMVELQVPFTVENLGAAHNCAYCGQALVSAMDIEITPARETINYRKADKLHFLNN
jgi:hypothetical protein